MGGRSGEEPSNHLWTVYKYTSPKSATESCVCVCLSCYSGAQLTGTTCQRIGPLLSPSGSGAQREWLPGGTEEWVKCHRLELVAARGGDRPAASFHQGWSAMIQQPLSALSTQVPAFRGAVPSSPGAVLMPGQECFGTLLPGVPTHESQPGVLCQQTPPSQEGVYTRLSWTQAAPRPWSNKPWLSQGYCWRKGGLRIGVCVGTFTNILLRHSGCLW